MNPESSEAQAGRQCLDGLAGRPGDGEDHAEGARLRSALDGLPAFKPLAPPWADLRARAGLPAAPPPGWDRPAANDAVPPLGGRGVKAARRAGAPWWLAAGGALLVAALAWSVLRPTAPTALPEPAWRGSGSAEAVWVSASAQADAASLASDLRALGAEVQSQPVADGVLLQIQAAEAARPGVNARLVPLELALDRDGRLRLRVQPVPKAGQP